MSDEREELRARIARLEQEAEMNRAFFSRAMTQANEGPGRARGPTVWHALSLLVGVGIGVLGTVALVVARGQPPTAVPLPPERPRAAVLRPVAEPVVVRDAGGSVVDAGAPSAVVRSRPDDSGALNLSATSAAVVFVDGKRVGSAPVRGFSVRAGEHVVRFDCATDAGLAAESTVNVPPFADVDVEHRCE